MPWGGPWLGAFGGAWLGGTAGSSLIPPSSPAVLSPGVYNAAVSIDVYDTSGALTGNGPIKTVQAWRVTRALDQPTQWVVRFAALEELAQQIKAGWTISLKHRDSVPTDPAPNTGTTEFLVNRGVVNVHNFVYEGQGVVYEMQGESGNGLQTVRVTGPEEGYYHMPISSVVYTSMGYIYPSTTWVPPAMPVTASSWANKTFKGIFRNEPRWAAAVNAANAVGCSLSERWTDLRVVSKMVPEYSGIRLLNVESYDANMLEESSTFGVISGLPQLQVDGTDIINRVFAEGGEIPDSDPPQKITLAHALVNWPFAVQLDSWQRTYIEDTTSIAAHGLRETNLVKTDIRPGIGVSPVGAGNLLYQSAMAELLTKRSERMYITVEIANPKNLWAALPGYTCRVSYRGAAIDPVTGRTTWLDFEDRLMRINQREDYGDATGARGLRLTFGVMETIFTFPPIDPNVDIPPTGWDEGSGDDEPQPYPDDESPADPFDPNKDKDPCCDDKDEKDDSDNQNDNDEICDIVVSGQKAQRISGGGGNFNWNVQTAKTAFVCFWGVPVVTGFSADGATASLEGSASSGGVSMSVYKIIPDTVPANLTIEVTTDGSDTDELVYISVQIDLEDASVVQSQSDDIDPGNGIAMVMDPFADPDNMCLAFCGTYSTPPPAPLWSPTSQLILVGTPAGLLALNSAWSAEVTSSAWAGGTAAAAGVALEIGCTK